MQERLRDLPTFWSIAQPIFAMKLSPHRFASMKALKATIPFHNGRRKYHLTKQFRIRASIATEDSNWQNVFLSWRNSASWIQLARRELSLQRKTKSQPCRALLPCAIWTQKSAEMKS